MTLFLLFGAMLLLVILLNKKVMFRFADDRSVFIQWFKNKSWFQNPLLAGLVLFLLNAFLFATAVGLIFLTSLLQIVYIHLLIMAAATAASLYVWDAFRKTIIRPLRDRLIAGEIGSSFYLLLLLTFIYMNMNLGPDTPENDTFMAFVGLAIGMFVSLVAFLICLYMTVISKPGKRI